MRFSVSMGIQLVIAGSLLTLCSCSRTDRDEMNKLKADLETARAEAETAKAELARLNGMSNPVAPPGKTGTMKVVDSAKNKGSGEFKIKDGKTRRFTALSGVKASQTPQLTFTHQKLPEELFFSTVDQRELLIPISKLASVTIRETDNTSNPEAEVVPITGAKQVFRYWILSSMMDVSWEGSIATERMHLAGNLTIYFDR